MCLAPHTHYPNRGCDWLEQKVFSVLFQLPRGQQGRLPQKAVGKHGQPGMHYLCSECQAERLVTLQSLGWSVVANKKWTVLQSETESLRCFLSVAYFFEVKITSIWCGEIKQETMAEQQQSWTKCNMAWKMFVFAHRMQGLQWGCPLHADGRLWSARGAWGGRAGPGGSGYTELFHAAGAASFHQSTNTVQTNGGKEATQEELWPSIQLSVKGKL